MTVNAIHHLRRAVLPGLAAFATVAVVLIATSTSAVAAEAPVSLGTASSFSVLAGSTVTNTGPSSLAQGLGVHPGTARTGFPPGLVGGQTHLGDAVALQAKSDLTAAYNDAAGRTPFTSHASELGGSTLTPGVYRVGAAQVTGQLTLNAQNNPQAVFIFQIASTLITASNSSVIFVNGASPCNVYWQVGSSATLGTGTSFVGNVMALTSITMASGASLNGRALARNAAVTLDNNAINHPQCLQPTTSPSASPTGSPTTSPTVSPTGSKTTSPPVTHQPTGTPAVSPTVLPTTGSAPVPILAGTGLLLAALGGISLFLYRRRARQS